MAQKVLVTTVTTILVGVFFSFIAAMSLYRSEQQTIELEIQKDVENATLSLGRELNLGIELLYALRNQVLISNRLNEKIFMTMARRIMNRHFNIRAMEWVEFVPGEERQHYESEVKRELSSFQIVEFNVDGDLVKVGYRQHYFPIRYITPYGKKQNIRGFDLGSSPSMKKALEMSWYRGVPIAKPAIRLQHEFKKHSNFLMFLPVFYGEPETDADRQTALRGFIVALFDIADIFAMTINKTADELINLELIDKGIQGESGVILDTVVDLSEPISMEFTYASHPIYFAGREWVLKGTPSVIYVKSRMSVYPSLIFFVGVTLVTVFTYLLYVLQNGVCRIQKRVDTKTRELREANIKLEKISKAVGVTGDNNRDYFNLSVQAEIKRSHRDQVAVSMFIIEIDNMRKYNAKHGRVSGDKSLRMISQVLANKLKRSSDLFSWYGSESFGILLPNTKDGRPLANKCLDAVRMLKLPFDKESGDDIVTVSIGGVTVLNTSAFDAPKLMAYAEIALNKAIEGGRNQCKWIYLPKKTSQ
ncbi:CHASE domain-containing protein [Candidatus Enterovibrio escicola]|uniref:CHASE domain-containing protein n=1 Tax=Candidatus Enterovibrio escicola TaxID=1927127 RepID=UPI001CC22A9D|nr:CHASE domain-containing protein [Candidatus Enterovibrio escacola]